MILVMVGVNPEHCQKLWAYSGHTLLRCIMLRSIHTGGKNEYEPTWDVFMRQKENKEVGGNLGCKICKYIWMRKQIPKASLTKTRQLTPVKWITSIYSVETWCKITQEWPWNPIETYISASNTNSHRPPHFYMTTSVSISFPCLQLRKHF